MAGLARRALAGFLLVLAGCSDRAERAPGTIRLIDRLAEVEVATGRAAGALKGRRRAPVGGGSARGRGLLASIPRPLGEGYDRRAAFLVDPGTRLVWRQTVDGPRELRVGLAAVQRGESGSSRARFRIAAGRGNGPLEMLSDLELDSRADGPWRDVRIPLPADGFDRLELELAAGGSARGAWSAPEIVAPETESSRLNLILISLDTLRADRLGAYGYREQPTSPHLDRFAARAIRFETAVAQSPWTRPSHRAMLSGVYPASDGDLKRVPVATALWSAGYRTLALTAGGQIDARFELDEGFESYAVDRNWVHEPERGLAAIEASPGREFFLFLHTYEIHDPYTDRRFLSAGDCSSLGAEFSNRSYKLLRRGLTDAEKRCVGALYDGDIAFTDERLQRLFARLEASGRLADTIVVVTSDHGEQFWEHGGWRHGGNMYEHQIRVPLLLWLPEAARGRFPAGAPGRDGAGVITDPVALVDLAPSIYELLGVAAAQPMHGRSFVPLLAGVAGEAREILSENTNLSKVERKSIRTERFKFIRAFSKVADRPAPDPEFSLFDLRRDPREQDDLASLRPEAVRALALRLEALTAGGLGNLDSEVPQQLDADLRKELEALGYVGN